MLEEKLVNNQATKEFTVSEISGRIKDLLENQVGVVRIRGEISGLKIAASGHGYFNLKDNSAVLGCTCWRPILAKLNFQLSEGMEVTAIGKITAYAGQSKYQLSAEQITPAGIGAMMQILKERRIALEKEGLFDKACKKPLPFFPHRIGVVTSITGAVIRDIIHRISDRFPTNVIIWPVTVQGETAAAEITEAIEGFNCAPADIRPDVIIVARGGGSIEDLWPFNEEIVVRAAANSSIPIISAVGHETDYTLIDLAADLRAPTPTAAAEFASPVLSSLIATLSSYYTRLASKFSDIIRYNDQLVKSYDRITSHAQNRLSSLEQKIDELGFKLLDSLPNLLQLKNAGLKQYSAGRLDPSRILDYKILQLKHQTDHLAQIATKNITEKEHRLALSASLLQSLDYKNTLKRGFALVKTANGDFISSQNELTSGLELDIEFYDGTARVVTKTLSENA